MKKIFLVIRAVIGNTPRKPAHQRDEVSPARAPSSVCSYRRTDRAARGASAAASGRPAPNQRRSWSGIESTPAPRFGALKLARPRTDATHVRIGAGSGARADASVHLTLPFAAISAPTYTTGTFNPGPVMQSFSAGRSRSMTS